MADSRTAAQLQIDAEKWPLSAKLTYLLLAFTSSLALTFYFAGDDFTDSQEYVLFILFFSIGLWLTEAIPPYAVGILIIGYLVYTQGSEYLNSDPGSVSKYLGTWVSPVIWLMLGGFFLAEGMSKAGLDRALFKVAVGKVGNSPKWVLLSIMLVTAFASMIMSNTATTAMMVAAVTPFLKSLDKGSKFAKALLLGIPAAASVGGMGTIIGSPPNAVAVGVLNESYGINIDFVQWMMYGFPIAIVLVFFFWAILLWYSRGVGALDMSIIKDGVDLKHENNLNRKIVGIILALTLGLWFTAPIHHIPAAVVAGIPIVGLTVTGVLTQVDVRKLPWDTLMLVAGGLSLGVAIVETGLAKMFVASIDTDGFSPVTICVLFGLLTVLMSNIMSNTATATILIPIGALLLPTNPIFMVLTVGLCASTALFLPVSTPPNAIAYSSGMLKASDFKLGGISVGLMGPLVVVLWMLSLTMM